MDGGSNQTSSGVNYPFPEDNVNPRIKEDKKMWGLQVPKAIWYNRAFNNPYLFYNVRRDYYLRIDFALGLNNPDEFKPMLGINPREAQKTFLPNMDWSIKNYATKRVNIATAKIVNQRYDPQFQPGDPFSIDREKDYKAKLKAYMEQQKFLQEVNQLLGIDVQTTPEDIDPDLMPQNDTEAEIHMKVHYKDRGAAWLEKRVLHFLDRNRYEEIKSEGAFYEFVLGVRIEHVGSDAYGRPQIRSINPAKYICPYLPTQYPTNLQYGADIEFYEVADARKLWEGEFTKDEEDYIIRNHATTEQLYYDNFGGGNNSASTKKIGILRFEYRSVDERVYVESQDKFNNTRFVERDYNFYRSPQQQAKFHEKFGDKASLIRDGVDTVYSGYWIVNSDITFKYGRQSWQEGEWGALGQGRIGYKVAAPNLKDGKVVATIDMMIPILRELQRYHLKVQHIAAASVPKGIAIDLEALRRADLKGIDGKAMTDLEKIAFYQQSGIYVFNPGDGNIYGKGASQKPIYEIENGVAKDIVYFTELSREALLQLDEVIGLNQVSSASPSVHERKGARVAQMQNQSTENALYYLYAADAHIYKEVCKSLGIKAIQSELMNPGYYKEVFGQSSADFIREFRLDKIDFGLRLEIQPSNEEWQQFYGEAMEARKDGIITMSQFLLLKRVPTLKEAEALFRLFEERARRQAAEAESANIQNTAKVQSDTAEQSHEFSKEVEKIKLSGVTAKVQGELMNTQIEGQQELQQMYVQAFLDGKLTEESIRIKGDEDAQLIIIKGQIQKDIERIKVRNQINTQSQKKPVKQ
ncbi:hypothetical protein LCGC14_1100370 [marine sediment metagenome]|uniref:Portal protein n=1 Tax=marine sediment metagenome TaxID=412755 RepID=A0A0F9PSU2_9ZZZZ